MKSKFWADYTASEIAELDKSNLVVVLPVGAIEQHGPHLPVCVDQAILDGLIAATIPKLNNDLRVLFLPTIPIGKSDEHISYAGTLTLTAETVMQVWREIGDSIARAGVERLVILNSHGGQIAPMDIVARDLRRRHGMIVVAASWFAMGLPKGLFEPDEERFGLHAGDMETSVMLALRPDLVEMTKAANFVPLAKRIETQNELVGLNPGGKLAWIAEDQHPSGACGNAGAATVEKGVAVIEHAVAEIGKLLCEVASLDKNAVIASTTPDLGL
ncbi:MAG: creatininase family protein [Marivivens sp.]|nr:creatininase family protein [Marivivens sp.]